MLLRLTFLLTALCAGPALAQTYDTSRVESCMGGKSGADAQACVGQASDACMTTSGGDTTAGMISCAAAEAEQWDALLNASYTKLIAQAKSADADRAANGVTEPPTEPALRAAQRAWVVWRDAECAFQSAAFRGGSNAALSAEVCKMRLTGERALNLRDQSEDGQ